VNTTETKIQTAARVAGDAILAGDPGAVFNRRARRDQALALLDDWQANGLPAGAWKLDKAKVITRMRRLVSLPHTLNQGYLDSCNYVCILYLCLLRFPVETVTAARNLYERGVAELGGLQLRPSEVLRNTTEDAIVADDQAARAASRDAGHWIPPPMDSTDWMLQVALFQAIARKPGFTGLGESRKDMGLSDSITWRNHIAELPQLFAGIDLTTAVPLRDAFDDHFANQLAKPNPQVELLIWLQPSVFPYASFSLTGLHAVVVHGRARRLGGNVDLAVYSYGGLEVLTVSYSHLRTALQALIAVTVA
jgi:hypothetical protein